MQFTFFSIQPKSPPPQRERESWKLRKFCRSYINMDKIKHQFVEIRGLKLHIAEIGTGIQFYFLSYILYNLCLDSMNFLHRTNVCVCVLYDS